jgi:protein TonB
MAWRVVVEAPGLVAEARPEHVTARVRLRLLVRADGTVGAVDVFVSSGRAELDDAAVSAAQAWRFAPARRDGEPVASRVLIWVAFVLEP